MGCSGSRSSNTGTVCYYHRMITAKRNLLEMLLKRRQFTGLMELYEINYRLLHKLIPALEAISSSAVSHVSGSPDLHLQVEQRCKFTTMLSLTYYFDSEAGDAVCNPDLRIRMYHDARLAEAMTSRSDEFPLMQLPDGGEPGAVGRRWDGNLFLEKWLVYTLTQGHRFGLGDVIDDAHEAPDERLETS